METIIVESKIHVTHFDTPTNADQFRVVKVELNRPQIKNAFNVKMIEELTSTFAQLNQEKDIRCIHLVGAGNSFCSGADIAWMRSMAQFTQQENQKDSQNLYNLFATIQESPVPIVAEVRGFAMGGALGLLAVSDVVVADSSSQFCFSEAKLGIAPAVIAAFVKNKMSYSHMNHLFLTAQMFTAEVALRTGLIHNVVEEDLLASEVQATIEMICKNGPTAIKKIKQLSKKVQSESQLKEYTTQLIAELRVGAEGQEGLKSFFERRNPRWTARGDSQ